MCNKRFSFIDFGKISIFRFGLFVVAHFHCRKVGNLKLRHEKMMGNQRVRNCKITWWSDWISQFRDLTSPYTIRLVIQ